MRALPIRIAQQINEKLRQFATTPEALMNNVARLQGSQYSRLRVGD